MIKTLEELEAAEIGDSLWDHHGGVPASLRDKLHVDSLHVTWSIVDKLLHDVKQQDQRNNKIVYLIEKPVGGTGAFVAACRYDYAGWLFVMQ